MMTATTTAPTTPPAESTASPAAVAAPPSWRTDWVQRGQSLTLERDIELTFEQGAAVLTTTLRTTPEATRAIQHAGIAAVSNADAQQATRSALDAQPDVQRYHQLLQQIGDVEQELKQLRRDQTRAGLDAADAEANAKGVALAEAIAKHRGIQQAIAGRISAAETGMTELRQRLANARRDAETAAKRVAQTLRQSRLADASLALRQRLDDLAALAGPALDAILLASETVRHWETGYHVEQLVLTTLGARPANLPEARTPAEPTTPPKDPFSIAQVNESQEAWNNYQAAEQAKRWSGAADAKQREVGGKIDREGFELEPVTA